ncbi:MAG: HAD-IIIA family hydrolase [Candidatus Muirbacterium halophilum]|nr:HAD-IIIA family hydrolase [Candidatus Muirbacterium halophilum]MCK9474535.1 HAD-IIIA family hydrolase [Candidatus Muirbacterium halophilum]
MIKMIVLDVDGTLTDGNIYYTSAGEEIKQFNVKDGMGITLANRLGIKFVIITGRTSEIVQKRAIELGITDVYQGSNKKLDILKNLCIKYKIDKDEIAYIGDDINDLSCMKYVKLPMTTADSVDEVKKVCEFISIKNGGNGAVRECIDHILKLNNLYEKALKHYEA